MRAQDTKTKKPHVFVYHGTLPPALALLLVAPVLFVFLSFAAVLLAGGTLAALGLPLLLRRRLRRADAESDAITLERDQYSRVDPDAPKLPPR
jgi:hypothetical protein